MASLRYGTCRYYLISETDDDNGQDDMLFMA